MGYHPVNLALRFFLELAALFFIGRWGWVQHEGLWRYVLVIISYGRIQRVMQR